MGTRINVLLEHELPDHRDRDFTLTRLAPALPGALSLLDYWNTADPKNPHSELKSWRAEPEHPVNQKLVRYTGPGSLFLTVTQRTAHIRTGGRWRGFTSMAPLRLAHLAAFTSIATTLGAKSMALFADCDPVLDLFYEDRSFSECVAYLEQTLGSPQASVEHANPVNGDVFRMWFVQSL